MKRVSGIRAVTFDCWGTLLKDRDWEGAMSIRIGALRRFLDLSEDEARALIDEAWGHHEEAWMQMESFGPGRMAAYCLEKHGIFDDAKISELTKEFEEASLKTGVERVEGAKEVLEALQTAGIRRALICDTGLTPGRLVRQLLEECELAEYLEYMAFSDEVGVTKPDNEIFAKALAELGVRPPEALHIGDLRRTDIQGAHDIGMHAIRFRGVHDDQSDIHDARIVIDKMEELVEILDIEGKAA